MKIIALVAFTAIALWFVLRFLLPKGSFRPVSENNWEQGNLTRDRSLDNDIPSPTSRLPVDGGGTGGVD